MKFLVDAQLPKRLAELINDLGYDAIHTLDLPDKNNTQDSEIAKFANDQDRVVISKDSDFLESFLIKSEPSKLILVKTGNITNRELLTLFKNHWHKIVSMISQSNLVEIRIDEIIER